MNGRLSLRRKMRVPIYPLIAFAVFAAVVPSGLQAQDCQNSRLKGNYLNFALGAVDVPDTPFTVPFRRLFRVVFDGAGDSQVTAAYSTFNGTIFGPDTFTGTYTIHADCTATITFELPIPLGFTGTFQGVLSSDFKKLDFSLAVDPFSFGGNLVSHLSKQGIKKCTGNEDLSGPYGFELQGTIVGPPAMAPAGDFSRLGLLVADGSGGFTANTTVNYNGTPSVENLKGTYKVDSDCLVTLKYTTPYGPITVWGGLTDDGNGAELLEIGSTAPVAEGAPVATGAAVAGSLYRAGN
jgi:hypothetical protein